MRCADLFLAAALALVAGCGGSSTSTEQQLICNGAQSCNVAEAVVDTPTGDNTVEIVVDSGPGFSLGVTNLPFVTVTLCRPGSTTACTTLDHVMLDTGSVGLRVLKSRVAALALPALDAPADAASGQPAGRAAECYPFVLGSVWGPMATADLRIAGEQATGLAVQLIDDDATPDPAVPAVCASAANGGLMNSAATLGANGILGIGSTDIDCGVPCLGNAYPGGQPLYWSCGAGGCVPAGLPADRQMRNPIAMFESDTNGAMIVMPALPRLGAVVARGRLVFGIGTRTNNQIPLSAATITLETDPVNANYLSASTRIGTRDYPSSYIDTGANALFFDDATLPRTCKTLAGTGNAWYCPAAASPQTATFTGANGSQRSVDFSVSSADLLFGTGSAALANLAGDGGQGSGTFAWGLPFFYGRTVFVSIWGQALAVNGPWYAF